jgi:hypothetical protein
MTEDADSAIETSLYIALGKLTVQFQALERLIDLLVKTLAGPDNPVADCLTAALPFTQLTHVLETAYACRTGAELPITGQDQLEELCKEARRLEQRRNQLVHSSWHLNEGVPQRSKRDRRTGQLAVEQVPPEHVIGTVREMEALSNDLVDFVTNPLRMELFDFIFTCSS